jgi:hypothetical protein
MQSCLALIILRKDDAGLPHCTAHGLRKAATARLAELGAAENEIMAITDRRTSRKSSGTRVGHVSAFWLRTLSHDSDRPM